jgi:S-formylglutathione hydrolase FrmB
LRSVLVENGAGVTPARREQSLWLVAVVTTALLVLMAAQASAGTLKTVLIPDRAGEIPSKWLSYYHGTPRANVLLPAGYSPRRRYPLLVLLAGLNGNYDSYVHSGDTVLFKGFRGIVVMPEGSDGWYVDWWNNGERGNPAWESYELNEVIPYVLRHFRILPGRRWHAIAGISMGGLGASYLGGRLPGFFGSVATLSGTSSTQASPP